MCGILKKSGAPAPGEFEIEILSDGTVKVVTGSFPAGAAHMAAEDFMRFLAEELGGTQERKARSKSDHVHTHVHSHGGLKIGGHH